MFGFPKYNIKLKSITILLFILLINNQNSIAFDNPTQIDSTKYTYVDIKAGDLCIVCDMPINAETGIAFLFNGRRVTIDVMHFTDFIKNPEKYFYKLQPNAALYNDEILDIIKMNYRWLIFGLWILMALVSSAFAVNISMKKGLNIKKWFYVALITNIFGLIYLILKAKTESMILPEKLGKITLTNPPAICPNCAVYNHPSANKCNSCGMSLNSTLKPETQKI
jgi:hypothetical protein